MKTYRTFSALALLVLFAGCQSPQLGSFWGGKLKRKNSPQETKLADAKAADTKQAVDSKVTRPGAGSHNLEYVGFESESRSARDDQHNSKSINDKLVQGHRMADAGRFEEAKHYYRLVLEEAPDHPIAHHRMAIIADEQKNFRAAEYHYRNALDADMSNPDVLSDIGWSYILQGKYQNAEEILSSALVYDRLHRKSLDRLGYLYFQQGNEERAKELLSRGCSPVEAQQKIASLLTHQRPMPRTPNSVHMATGSRGPSNENQWPLVTSAGRVEEAAATHAAPTTGFDANSPARQWPQTHSMNSNFAGGNAATNQAHLPHIPQTTQGQFAAFPGPTISPAGQNHSGADSRLNAGPPQYATASTSDYHRAGSTADCPPGQCQIPRVAAGGDSGPAQLPTVNDNPLDSMPFFPTIAAGQGRAATSPTGVVSAGSQSAQTSWPAASAGVQPAGYENRAAIENWPHAPNSRGAAGSEYTSAGRSSAFGQNQSPSVLPGGHYSSTHAGHQAAIVGLNAGTNRAAFPVIDGNAGGSASMSGDNPWPDRRPMPTQPDPRTSRTAEIPSSHQFTGLATDGRWSNDRVPAGNHYYNSGGQSAVPHSSAPQQGRTLNGPVATMPQYQPSGAAVFPGTSPQQWPADPRTNAYHSDANSHNWQQQPMQSGGAANWPPPANNYPQYNPIQRSEWQQPPPQTQSYSDGLGAYQGW